MHLDKLCKLAAVGNQQETCHSENTLSSTSVIIKNTSETLFPHETWHLILLSWNTTYILFENHCLFSRKSRHKHQQWKICFLMENVLKKTVPHMQQQYNSRYAYSRSLIWVYDTSIKRNTFQKGSNHLKGVDKLIPEGNSTIPEVAGQTELTPEVVPERDQ